ncbi:maleylpyruvate isomerase family mycothiol-dependent enzyme [Nocardia sp. CA-084685]|uniref:maleylpyruvate isomerase family mycothiol-dependent enzyme n=1 Tax=Nocardia sp. CA-084685 TaxID=3239970 RepID=UPI003D97C257
MMAPAGPALAVGLRLAYDSIIALIRQLSAQDWDAPTRCTGWSVRDVAAHIAGTAADSATGNAGKRTPDEQARGLRALRPEEIADLLAQSSRVITDYLEVLAPTAWQRPSGHLGHTLSQATLLLWYDVYVHTDDIRSAIGLPSDRGPGLAAAVAHIEDRLKQRDYGPARIMLHDLGELRFGTGGPEIAADPLHFLLVATGRADPATLELDGRVNIYRPITI